MSAFEKESIHFLSADKKNQVAGFFYTPVQAPPRAVIQLSHGMCEYICRYEPMFEVLAQAGFAIAGNDHLGHGDTVSTPRDFGFMAEKDGYQFVLQDLHTMNTLTHEKYPGLPFFLLGHSMGSFYARWHAEMFPETIDGLLISGTGGPSPVMPAGKALCGLMAKRKGPRYVSPFVVKVSMGSYCKKIDAPTSGNAWLSRDPKVWEEYGQDEKCNFSFSVSAYRDMLTAYVHVNRKAWAESLPKALPVLLYAGDMDPVGNYGKGVRKVYEMLKGAGMEDVTLKLYPGGRHEMHNEINKDQVFADVIEWLDERLQTRNA